MLVAKNISNDAPWNEMIFARRVVRAEMPIWVPCEEFEDGDFSILVDCKRGLPVDVRPFESGPTCL